MKKPNLKMLTVDVINLALRGTVILDYPRMMYLERKHAKKLHEEAVKAELVEQLTVMLALTYINERIDAGTYNVAEEDQLADFHQELAFAKIAVQNI